MRLEVNLTARGRPNEIGQHQRKSLIYSDFLGFSERLRTSSEEGKIVYWLPPRDSNPDMLIQSSSKDIDSKQDL